MLRAPEANCKVRGGALVFIRVGRRRRRTGKLRLRPTTAAAATRPGYLAVINQAPNRNPDQQMAGDVEGAPPDDTDVKTHARTLLVGNKVTAFTLARKTRGTDAGAPLTYSRGCCCASSLALFSFLLALDSHQHLRSLLPSVRPVPSRRVCYLALRFSVRCSLPFVFCLLRSFHFLDRRWRWGFPSHTHTRALARTDC